jgi:hypothetical protein
MLRLAAIAALLSLAAGSPFPQTLPAFTLQDPLGKTFASAALVRRGLVVVVTAPTYSQGDAQESWDRAFDGLAWSEDGPTFAMVQDMSQSWFRKTVLGRMREKYDGKSPPWLLLDEDGSVRRAFGLEKNATVAFAFSPGGRRLAVETGAGTKERAERLLAAVRDAR